MDVAARRAGGGGGRLGRKPPLSACRGTKSPAVIANGPNVRSRDVFCGGDPMVGNGFGRERHATEPDRANGVKRKSYWKCAVLRAAQDEAVLRQAQAERTWGEIVTDMKLFRSAPYAVSVTVSRRQAWSEGSAGLPRCDRRDERLVMAIRHGRPGRRYVAHNCFEAFAGGREAIESLIAPSGQWAAYAFDAPRRGMRTPTRRSRCGSMARRLDKLRAAVYERHCA